MKIYYYVVFQGNDWKGYAGPYNTKEAAQEALDNKIIATPCDDMTITIEELNHRVSNITELFKEIGDKE